MKRILLLGLLAGVAVPPLHGQDWRGLRPAEGVSSQAAYPGVQLGKPIGGRTVAQNQELRNPPPMPADAFTRTLYQSVPPLPSSQDGRHVGRRTSYAGPAGSPEEQFNCGVVTEGPPSGGPPRWFGDMFGSGSSDWCNRLGISWQPDHQFDGFISPVSNPFFFEDPRSLTEVRPIIMYQKIPGDNPLYSGGNVEFYGLQARLAFNEYFSVVMPKLGYVRLNSDGIAPNGDGLSEIMIGPKLTFLRNDASRTLMAFGVNFEIPIGGESAFQSSGNGGVTPYLSFGQELADFHFLAAAGYRWAFNTDRADMFFLSGHVDYGFFRVVYPLVELNWYHYTSNGNQFPANFEGRDLLMFGSNDVKNRDVLTLAAGVRFKIVGERVQAGIVYEFPISNNKDFIDYRITADLIFRY